MGAWIRGLVLFGFGVSAACGDDGTHHLADAPAGRDAPVGSDAAAPIDAPLAPVSVAVTSAGSAAPEVKVYFLDADSTVVSNTTTGADGTASALVAAGGSVTVIEPLVGDSAQTLVTFAAVKPGDALHLDLQPVSTQTAILVTISLPPLPANATRFQLSSTCQETDAMSTLRARHAGHAAAGKRAVPAGGPVQQFRLVSCGATVDFFVVALDANFNVIDTIYDPGQTVTDDGSLAIAGPFVAAGTDTISVTNVPGSWLALDIDKALVTANGVAYDASTTTGMTTGSAAQTLTASLPFSTAVSTPAATQVLHVSGGPHPGFDVQDIFVWGAPADTSALDFATLALPDYANAPSFDIATQAVTWTPTAGGVAPDTVRAVLDVGRGNTSWFWYLAAPAGTLGTVKFPTVPTDVFAFNPTTGDEAGVDSLETAVLPGGYDALRPQAFAAGDLINLPISGGSGQIAVTSISD